MYFGNLTSEYNTAVCDGREDGKKIFPDRRGNCGAKKCSRKKAKNQKMTGPHPESEKSAEYEAQSNTNNIWRVWNYI